MSRKFIPRYFSYDNTLIKYHCSRYEHQMNPLFGMIILNTNCRTSKLSHWEVLYCVGVNSDRHVAMCACRMFSGLLVGDIVHAFLLSRYVSLCLFGCCGKFKWVKWQFKREMRLKRRKYKRWIISTCCFASWT